MTMENASQSEVARLRQQIVLEYEAAYRALTAPASGSARHAVITAKMERIGDHQLALASLIGEEASMEILCGIFEGDPPQGSQHTRTGG